MASAAKVEAAAQAIEAAGYEGLARNFREHPEYRLDVAHAMERNASRKFGREVGRQLAKQLRAAAR